MSINIDLNGGFAGSNDTTAYSENAGAVSLFTAATISSPGGSTSTSPGGHVIDTLRVALGAGFTAEERLSAGSLPTGFVATFEGGILTIRCLTAAQTDANWQTVLRSIQYINTSDAPPVQRVVSVAAYDTDNAVSPTFPLPTGIDTTSSPTRTDTIAITPSNDAPVVEANFTLPVDEASIATPLGINLPIDPDGDPLTIIVTAMPLGGTLSKVDGSAVAIGSSLTAAELAGLIYTAPAELATSTNYTFSYTVTDSIAATIARTVTIAVAPVNDAPEAVIAPTTFAATTGVSLSIKGIGLSVSDVDSATLTVSLAVTSGTLAVTAGGSGAAVAGSGTGLVTITGTPAQINALLSSDGTSTITFLSSIIGDSTLTLSASDGGTVVADTAVISIGTSTGNTPPTGAPTAVLAAGAEDAPYTVALADLIAGFSDADGDTLQVNTLTASNGTAAQNPDGSWTITPTANFNGAVTLTYTVSDGNGGNLTGQTRGYNVGPANDAPTGAPTAVLAAGAEDAPYTVALADLIAGFNDADGDTLQVNTLTTSNGTAAQNPDGSWTITPTANFNGAVTLTYTVSDGNGGNLTGQTRGYSVGPANDAPTGAPTAVLAAGAEDAPYTVALADLIAGFNDADGDTLQVNTLTASNGTAAQNPDGSWTITPTANFNGAVTLTYTVSDGNGGNLTGQTRGYTSARPTTRRPARRRQCWRRARKTRPTPSLWRI